MKLYNSKIIVTNVNEYRYEKYQYEIICLKVNNINLIHAYYCNQVNSTEPSIEYKLIYKGSIEQQLYILRQMQENNNIERILINEKKISQ